MAPGAEMTYGVISNCKARAGKSCAFGYTSFARISMDVSKRSSRCGGIMTEPTNQAATIQHDTTSLSTPGKRRSSALDRGFPSGKILLGLAALIILLQGIAAWKVVNLEQERAIVARLRAILEKDIKDHEYLTRELPGLKKEWGETETNVRHLRGEVAALEKQRASL